MDISNFFGEVDVVDQQQAEMQPGRYDLEYVNTNEALRSGKNGWMGMQLNFKVVSNGLPIGHTITVAHNEEKNKDWGKRELAKLAKAAGLTGVITDTDVLKGKTVNCLVKLNEGNYPEIESKFGDNWKPAEGKKVEASAPAPVEAVAPAETKVEEDLGDKIPF